MRYVANSLLVFQPMQGGTKSKTLVGILVALIRNQNIRELPACQTAVYTIVTHTAATAETVLGVCLVGTHAEVDEVVEYPAVACVDATGKEDQA